MSDLSETDKDTWVLGTSVFEITMPHANFNNPEGVIGYWTSGKLIRTSDVSRFYLDQSKFGQITRAGYNMFVVQV